MGASLGLRGFRVLMTLALPPFLWNCSDTVVLGDADGTVELQYDCDSFQPSATSASERSVVRQLAALAVRAAEWDGEKELAQGLVGANAVGDIGELERLLVEHLCRTGQGAEVIPDLEPIARGISRERGGFEESGLGLGVEAPRFRLPVLDEAYFDGEPSYESLSDHFGAHVLVTFGGPWCPPCVQQATALVPIWKRYRDRGLSVFEILYRDTPENGWRWSQEHIPGAFPTLVDEDFVVAKEYEVEGVPKTYLIGPIGEILWSAEGWGPHMPSELSDVLDRILPGAL